MQQPAKPMSAVMLVLIILGVLFCGFPLLAAIGWGIYETARQRTPEEEQVIKEDEKLRKEIERQNRKKGP